LGFFGGRLHTGTTRDTVFDLLLILLTKFLAGAGISKNKSTDSGLWATTLKGTLQLWVFFWVETKAT
jgi:hypothetical protein